MNIIEARTGPMPDDVRLFWYIVVAQGIAEHIAARRLYAALRPPTRASLRGLVASAIANHSAEWAATTLATYVLVGLLDREDAERIMAGLLGHLGRDGGEQAVDLLQRTGQVRAYCQMLAGSATEVREYLDAYWRRAAAVLLADDDWGFATRQVPGLAVAYQWTNDAAAAEE